MLIAITGSPKSGKTTLAKNIKKKLAKDMRKRLLVIYLDKWIKKYCKEAIVSYDKRLKAHVIDTKLVEKTLKKYLKEARKKYEYIIIESHLLPEIKIMFDIAIILDVKPILLYNRMKKARYNEEKIEENLIAVHLDYFFKKIKAKKKIRFKPKFTEEDVGKIEEIIKNVGKRG